MTQQLYILPLPSYHTTTQFSNLPYLFGSNLNHTFSKSSKNVVFSHLTKHKNSAVIKCIFQESLSESLDENFRTPSEGGNFFCLCSYLKNRRDFFSDYISFLWISPWIGRKLLLSTHHKLLHSCGTSSAIVHQLRSEPPFHVQHDRQCSAYPEIFCNFTFWNMTIFSVMVCWKLSQ